MKCPHCGSDIVDDVKFCTKCGQKINVPETPDDNLTDDIDTSLKEKPETDKNAGKDDDITPEKKEEILETTPEKNGISDKKEPEKAVEKPVNELEENRVIKEPVEHPQEPAKKGRWIKTTLIIIGVLVVLAIITMGAIFFGPKLFKTETFEDGFEKLDSDVWNVWREGENVLIKAQGGELVIRNGSLGLGKDMGKDYLIECGMNILTTTKKEGYAGISFRADKSGRYMVMLYPDKSKVVLRKYPGEVLTEKKINIKKGKWYLLAISVDGYKYAVFLSKQHIMTGTDIGFIKGGIGLEANNSTALFDDFYVEKR